MGECIHRFYGKMIEHLLSPIAAMAGAEYSPGKVSKKPRNKKKGKTKIDYTNLEEVKKAEERDAKLLMFRSKLID